MEEEVDTVDKDDPDQPIITMMTTMLMVGKMMMSMTLITMIITRISREEAEKGHGFRKSTPPENPKGPLHTPPRKHPQPLQQLQQRLQQQQLALLPPNLPEFGVVLETTTKVRYKM